MVVGDGAIQKKKKKKFHHRLATNIMSGLGTGVRGIISN